MKTMARQTRASGSPRKGERFSSVSPPQLQRSSFDRSMSHKTTFDSGLLIPIFVDEVLPGDTVNLRPAFLARMATPLKPFMDGLHLDYQFFYVPLRLVWDNFVRMMGERPDPADHNDYTIPQMVAPATVGHLIGSLSDYLGLPTDVPDYTHSTLFHRAYNLIFREWYRDENLTDPPVVDKDDGPDTVTDYTILRRAKRKDYFTGALLTAQKGTSVDLPLGTSAPLGGHGLVQPWDSGAQFPTFDMAGNIRNLQSDGTAVVQWSASVTTDDADWEEPALQTTMASAPSGKTQPFADLSNATAATINDMRVAITTQHLLERDARGGTRYREMVLAHFGVQTDDIRLLRPELLGTGTMTIEANEITAKNTNTDDDLGDTGAFVKGTSVGRGFVKSFREHGIIMGICSVRAELSYQQGLHRMFTRDTRLEFYWPDLSGLGEQAVESREIYTDGTGSESAKTGDFSVWGYQPRYEEYRHRPSIITGQFRSTATTSLDIWHIAQEFSTRPVLNNAFIEENPPIARIVVIDTEPEFLLDCFFKITHVRAMPRFGTPGLNRF